MSVVRAQFLINHTTFKFNMDIALLYLILLLTVNTSSHKNDTNERPAVRRVKRHSFKYDRCEPIKTTLREGKQILHEMPIRKERFFFLPGATFDRLILQLRLDNTFSHKSPKIYGDGVQFTRNDLKALKVPRNEWIQVWAEAYKYKRYLPDIWKIRLTVGNWSQEAVIEKWYKFYSFDNLVVSGIGGAEWTFDCIPSGDVLDYSSSSLRDLDLSDDRIWMVAALAAGILLIIGMIGVSCWICYRKPPKPNGNFAYLCKSISFRKKNKKKTACEDIYQEIGNASSLRELKNKIEELENGASQPPPLPAPNPPPKGSTSTFKFNKKRTLQDRCSYSTVLKPTPESYIKDDVMDTDWYSSMEHHRPMEAKDFPYMQLSAISSTPPKGTNAYDKLCVKPGHFSTEAGKSSASQHRNPYQNLAAITQTAPRPSASSSASGANTYVDMSKLSLK